MDINKKIIIALIGLFVLIIILFNVIMDLSGFRKEDKKQKPVVDREYQKKVEKVEKGKITGKYQTTNANYYYYSLDQEGRDLIDERIDYILSLINNKKYEEMYSLFSIDYKNAMFSTIDDFKKYMADNFKGKEYIAIGYEVYEDELYFDIAEDVNSLVFMPIFLYNYDADLTRKKNWW